MNKGYLEPILCPVCGKSFVPAYRHLYRIKRGGKIVKLCSYTCFNKTDEAKRRRNPL